MSAKKTGATKNGFRSLVSLPAPTQKSGLSLTETAKKSTQKTLIEQNISSILAYEAYGIQTESVIKPSEIFTGRYHFIDGDAERKTGCPFALPPSQYIAAEKPPKVPKTEDQIAKELYWLSYLCGGKYDVKTLMEWLNMRKKQAPILARQTLAGKWSFWRGSLRGTVEYAKKLLATIKHDAWELDRRFKYKFFVTWTFDAKKLTADRKQAWEEYSKYVSKALEKIRKKTHMMYQWVIESTYNGYPHAHIVFYTNDLITKALVHKKAGTELHAGVEYKLFRHYSPAPQMKVEWAKGKGSTHYLMKYIAKSAKETIMNEPHPNDKKKQKSWIKDVLTLAIPCAVGCRAYGKSQYWRIRPLDEANAHILAYETIAQREADNPHIEFDGSYQPNFKFLFSTDARTEWELQYWVFHWNIFLKKALSAEGAAARSAALDWLLINSEKNCSCTTHACFRTESKDALEPLINADCAKSDELTAYAKQHTKPIGCIDCLIKRILRRRHGEDVSLLVKEPNMDIKAAVNYSAPAGETRSAEEIRKEQLKNAKASCENDYKAAGLSYAWENLFAKIENWTKNDTKIAKLKLHSLLEYKEYNDAKEKAIKERSMERKQAWKLESEYQKYGFIPKIGRKYKTKSGVKTFWKYLAVGDWSDNMPLPDMVEVDSPDVADKYLSIQAAEVFARAYAKIDKSVSQIEWVLKDKPSVIGGGAML